MNTKRIRLLGAIWMFVKWFLGNIFFALLPLALLYYFKMLNIGDETNRLTSTEITSLLRGGIIVFFFCSLMGSIAVDVWLSNEHIEIGRQFPKMRKWIKIALLDIPFWTIVSLTTTYFFILYGDLEQDYFNNLSWFPIIVIGISFVYCFTYKVYNFVKGGK